MMSVIFVNAVSGHSIEATDHQSGMADAHVDIPPLEEPPVHIPDVSKVQRLAWKPRAFLFPQFLSEAECDYIVNYSRPRMERSTVLSNSGKSVQDSIRTSDGSFIVKYENPVIRRIEERVAAWTFLPIENQEAMQVLRYRDGQEYGAHWDYIDPAKAPTPGGPRYATVLMYLSNVEKGGETAFPESEEDTVLKDDSWSDCGKKGIAGMYYAPLDTPLHTSTHLYTAPLMRASYVSISPTHTPLFFPTPTPPTSLNVPAPNPYYASQFLPPLSTAPSPPSSHSPPPTPPSLSQPSPERETRCSSSPSTPNPPLPPSSPHSHYSQAQKGRRAALLLPAPGHILRPILPPCGLPRTGRGEVVRHQVDPRGELRSAAP
ncbi:unnamed protein product [Closterium sp. NIES-53]